MTKNNVTLPPAIDTLPMADGSLNAPLVSEALHKARIGLDKANKAAESAGVLCVAFGDTLVATWGTTDVLLANSKSDYSQNMQAIHHALKMEYFSAIWPADFLKWVRDTAASCKEERKPTDDNKKAIAHRASYWRAQMGNLWNKKGRGFISHVMAHVESANAKREKTKLAEERKAAGLPDVPDDTKAPNRNTAAMDAACKTDIGKAIKRIEAAVRDAKDIPKHVDVSAFLVLAKLACDALETSKAHKAKAVAALNAIRAAGLVK